MTFNSATIVQEIRKEFESIVEEVENDRTSTADGMERKILSWMLKLGCQLLTLYFVQRSSACEREKTSHTSGQEIPYIEERKRTYYSLFGRIEIWRPYFYKKGVGSATPFDRGLSLGDDRYSDVLREITEALGVEVAYEKAVGFIERLLGQRISSNAAQGMVSKDAQAVESYYEQKAPPEPATEACILVAQADGKGVPLVREEAAAAKVRLGKGEKRMKKKESIVTSLYTIEATPRSPEAVVASFFHAEERPSAQEAPQPHRPVNKQLWATLDGKDRALQRLAHQVNQRDGNHILHRVALADGCEALQTRMMNALPGFTLVLDFIHANEYLWKVANKLFGEQGTQRAPWVEKQTLQILSGATQAVIDELRRLRSLSRRTKSQIETLDTTANYFERNLPYMRYDDYLRLGWPIASGVIEGACRHFVKDRFELSGMRWTQDGAESLLRLRAISINDDWDDFHDFRKQQRHLRLYAFAHTDLSIPEDELFSLDDDAPDKIISLYPTQPRQRAQLKLAA